LNVVIAQSATVLELFSGKNETLLIWRDTFFVLNLGLDVFDGVTGLNLQGDGLPCQRFHENLHTATKSEDQVKGGFFLDVVITQGTSVLELLSSKDQPLLVWWNSFLVLDFRLHVLDSITGLNFQCDSFASQGLHEDLHTSTESENQVKGGFLLDVVVAQGSTVLELLSSEDQTLLIWWNSLFILDFRLHVLDSVTRLDFQSNSLASQGFHKDLHLR